MDVSVFDFVRPFKGPITTSLFSGNFNCDGENRIPKESEVYNKKRSYIVREIGPYGVIDNSGFLVVFVQKGNDVYIDTSTGSYKIEFRGSNQLVFMVEGVENFINFGS